MTETDATTFMSLGLNTGVFLLASLIVDDNGIDPRVAELLQQFASTEIEKLCGMPAEDFAGYISRLVDDLRGTIEKARNGE